ncbi:MAG TPA: class I SAM-dependent methyltransferase [Ktedonobacterales bacterium]|nr:class I SAM-dependent methyltransferase [Ktedonobacterales bacterium]
MPDNTWNPTLYDQKHSFVFGFGQDLVALLDPKQSDRILDLGCGTGHLTHAIDASGAQVVGIDASPEMIATAQAAYPDIAFHLMDARDFTFDEPFDAVFSNAVLHWITEAEQVAQRIAAALKPGGRFVTEFGGKGNVAAIISAMQQATREVLGTPIDLGWYYPSIGEYASLLERQRLETRSALLFDRPTLLEDGDQGFRNWIQMFRGRALQDIPDDARERVLSIAEDRARDTLFHDGSWHADYRRLRIVAVKQGEA